eukprot:6005642-Pyramimonas_sp.AAC.1
MKARRNQCRGVGLERCRVDPARMRLQEQQEECASQAAGLTGSPAASCQMLRAWPACARRPS